MKISFYTKRRIVYAVMVFAVFMCGYMLGIG